MAAGAGFKTFSTGEVLSAGDVNGYLMSQTVMVFADSSARSTAITSPQEGMISYLKDTNSTEYYSGSAWTAVGGGGSSGGWTLINTGGTALSGASTTIGSIPSTYKSLVVYIEDVLHSSAGAYLCLRVNNDTTANNHQRVGQSINTSTASVVSQLNNFAYLSDGALKNVDNNHFFALEINDYASSVNKNMTFWSTFLNSVDVPVTEMGVISFRSSSAVSSLVFYPDGGNFSGGTVYVYGVK